MNIKNIILVMSIAALSSCYGDKGNYVYNFDEMNSIDSLEFTPATVETLNGKTIEFTQPLTADDTQKRVDVKVRQSHHKNTDLLDFKWILSYQKDKKTVKDTIKTKGYLDVTLPVKQDTRISVRLEVKDQSTGLASYRNFTIATRPIYKNSLFFLHGKPGNMRLGNIETIGATTQVRSDAYKLIYKDATNVFADAYKLMYHYGLVAEGREFLKKYNLVVFSTNGETKVYNPFGMVPRYTEYKDFVIPQTPQGAFLPSNIIMTGDPSNQSDFYCMLGKDGRFLTARTIPSFKTPATDGSVSDYNVTAAAITANEFVFWDARHKRFLRVNKDDGYGIWAEQQAYQTQLNNPVLDANVDFKALGTALSPKDKTAVLGFIQYRENYEKANPHFIFKDNNSSNYYLYQLTSTRAEGDGDNNEDATAPAYTIKGQQLENFTPSSPSTVLYNTWFSTAFVFYAEGADVMRHNLNNGDKTVLYTAPDGYSISCMKFRSDDTFIYSGDLGRYLTIGMNKGDEGAITEVRLNTASDVDETYPIVVYNTDNEGNKLGNIKDFQFVREYSYTLPTR